jgi:hypothetical protein
MAFMTSASSASSATTASAVEGNTAVVVAEDITGWVTTTIPNAAAPHDFTYQTDLPAGAQIRSDGGTGLDFVKFGAPTKDGLSLVTWLGHMDAPWAYDAKGKQVPTSNEVAGSRIIQHVKISSTTAFPVTAGPNIYLKYTTPEVLFTSVATGKVRSTTALAALRGSICTLAGPDSSGFGCIPKDADQAIAAVASHAYANHQCLALTYGVFPHEVSCTTGK